jgi:DNA-binding PadR family transcriptional regulator
MSLLDLSLLGLLADQPLHGYELSKRLRDQGRGAVSYGALYPALGRLDRKGLVSSAAATAESATTAPMTGSLGAEVARLRRGVTNPAGRSKRKRKVYTITDAGRRRLHELLTTSAEDDRTFNLQVAFCERLEPTARLALFSSRRAELAARLANAHTAAGKSASSTTAAEGWRNRYRRALRDRDTASIRAELAWLDDLIAAESSGDSPDEPGIDAEPVHATNTTTVHGGSTR